MKINKQEIKDMIDQIENEKALTMVYFFVRAAVKEQPEEPEEEN